MQYKRNHWTRKKVRLMTTEYNIEISFTCVLLVPCYCLNCCSTQTPNQEEECWYASAWMQLVELGSWDTIMCHPGIHVPSWDTCVILGYMCHSTDVCLS